LLVLKENIRRYWDWFWYFRQGKIRYRVYDYGDSYCANASDGKVSVFNCYGNTPQGAKEVALYRISQAYKN